MVYAILTIPTHTDNLDRFPIETIILAVKGTGGDTRIIAEKLGCDRTSVYRILQRWDKGHSEIRKLYAKECCKAGVPLANSISKMLQCEAANEL